MSKELETLRYLTAQELFAALPEIGEDMTARPVRNEGVMTFASALLDSPTPEEAVTFAAQMFSRRVAIWWGHECLRHVRDLLEPTDHAMMQAAAAWVAAPDESARAALLDRALAEPIRSPGVWLALATGWAGTSLTPPETPPVQPPRYLTGRGVNAAVLAALARVEQPRRKGTLGDFVSMARDLAAPDLA
ncbi:MAG: hypothetical protein CMN17_10075 [Roseovarius sp.]|nr:hypothetical protein [Roseovarius sp.]MBK45173.1 hypothetical protein [Roseovarius sp.]